MTTTAAFGTQHRVCDSCGGAMPPRMSRQRDHDGRLVCDSCSTTKAPRWKSAHAATLLVASPEDRAEFYRREAEAVSSILRISRLRESAEAFVLGYQTRTGQALHVAHDMGDGGIVNHCAFCGSGAVVGGSDGTVECGFCHTIFSVQVQPSNPSMPQTVNGQPFVAPGMPAGEPTEMSEPKDPVAEQADQQSGEDPSGAQQPGHPSAGDPNPSSKDMIKDRQANPPHEKAKQDAADPTKSDNPFAKGDADPAKKDANPFAKGDPTKGDSHPDNDATNTGEEPVDPQTLKKVDDEEPDAVDPDDLVLVKKKKAASVIGTFRTPEGVVLGGEDYLKRLALDHADNRGAVLAEIRSEKA